MEYDKFLEESCIICDRTYPLTEIEQLGLDGFGEKVRITPISLFKYFPNTRQWDKKEKRYRNFSYEALTNNTVFYRMPKILMIVLIVLLIWIGRNFCVIESSNTVATLMLHTKKIAK